MAYEALCELAPTMSKVISYWFSSVPPTATTWARHVSGPLHLLSPCLVHSSHSYLHGPLPHCIHVLLKCYLSELPPTTLNVKIKSISIPYPSPLLYFSPWGLPKLNTMYSYLSCLLFVFLKGNINSMRKGIAYLVLCPQGMH